MDLRRLKNDVRPRRPRTRANRELDSKIISLQEDLVSGRYIIIILLFHYYLHYIELTTTNNYVKNLIFLGCH